MRFSRLIDDSLAANKENTALPQVKESPNLLFFYDSGGSIL